jgi:pimeloyl-ACP methyl ester carboxylesterase
VFPERVSKLVAIEGLGPPPGLIKARGETPAWKRMDDWIRQMQSFAARRPRHYPSIESAAARMREENAFLSEEQAQHLTVHGVMRNEDGTYSWKFDNYVRAFAPFRFDAEDMRSLWGRIACPTLLVRGTASWAGDPVEDGRIEAFGSARAVNIDEAGHWVHHDRLDAFLPAVREFLNGQG